MAKKKGITLSSSLKQVAKDVRTVGRGGMKQGRSSAKWIKRKLR